MSDTENLRNDIEWRDERTLIIEVLRPRRYASSAEDVAQEILLEDLEGSLPADFWDPQGFTRRIRRRANAILFKPLTLGEGYEVESPHGIDDEEEDDPRTARKLERLRIAFSDEDREKMTEKQRSGYTTQRELAQVCGIKPRTFRHRVSKVRRMSDGG